MRDDYQAGDRRQHHGAKPLRLERLAELGVCEWCGCEASFRVAEGEQQGETYCTTCADELFPFGDEEGRQMGNAAIDSPALRPYRIWCGYRGPGATWVLPINILHFYDGREALWRTQHFVTRLWLEQLGYTPARLHREVLEELEADALRDRRPCLVEGRSSILWLTCLEISGELLATVQAWARRGNASWTWSLELEAAQ